MSATHKRAATTNHWEFQTWYVQRAKAISQSRRSIRRNTMAVRFFGLLEFLMNSLDPCLGNRHILDL